jgi:LuxR family maltose regulon positive regulatory protein
VLSAPVGYGKTTLLSQCYAQWRREDVTVAWYSVDDSKFEAEQFFGYLMAALHRAGLPLPYSHEAIEAGLPGLAEEAAARAIVVALEVSDEPVRLIIDDYHRIASSTTDRFLNYVIDRMPHHAAIVIALRGFPKIALSNLRLTEQILELDQDDLRFSDSESWSFVGTEPNKVNWAKLIDRTQGWPGALQLLRLWLGGRDHTDTLENITRRSSNLADYLAEQVISRLSEDLQQFLYETSIAQRICKGLGDAILGRDDSGVLLEQWHKENSLITPVDDEGIWYSFHPLLREFAFDALSQDSQARLDGLHLRAAHWLAAENLLPEALAHAACISDRDASLSIMEAAGGWRMAIRGGLGMLRHIDDLDQLAMGSFPRVTLGQAYYAAQNGRLLEARFLLNGLFEARPIKEVERNDPALACEMLCNNLVTLIYEDRRFPTDFLAILERQLANEEHDPTLRVLLYHMSCLASFYSGDDLRCRSYGEKVCKLARRQQLPLLEVYAYQYLGLSQMRVGRRREAELYFRRSLETATRHFGEGGPQVAVAITLLAHTLYLSGDLSSATDMLESALPVIEATEGWHEVFVAAYATRAWFAVRSGNLAQAEHVIHRGHQTAERRNLPRLRYQLDLIRVRMLLSLGRIEPAKQLLDELGEPLEAFLERDQRLWCDYCVARIACMLQHSECDEHFISSLALDVAEVSSIVLEIEIGILRATDAAVRGRRAEAAHVFRRALEAAENEGLIGVVSQFGALLPILLGACEEALHVFGPAQRTIVARLHQSSLVDRDNPSMIPPTASDIIVTPREVEVLRALADGMSSKEIARCLGVAESTIKTHRVNIYRKLDVVTRSRAISAARNLRLI